MLRLDVQNCSFSLRGVDVDTGPSSRPRSPYFSFSKWVLGASPAAPRPLPSPLRSRRALAELSGSTRGLAIGLAIGLFCLLLALTYATVLCVRAWGKPGCPFAKKKEPKSIGGASGLPSSDLHPDLERGARQAEDEGEDAVPEKRKILQTFAIEPDSIVLQAHLDSGGAGSVFRGTYLEEEVAVKVIFLDPNVRDEGLNEILMGLIGIHPNCVRHFGFFRTLVRMKAVRDAQGTVVGHTPVFLDHRKPAFLFRTPRPSLTDTAEDPSRPPSRPPPSHPDSRDPHAPSSSSHPPSTQALSSSAYSLDPPSGTGPHLQDPGKPSAKPPAQLGIGIDALALQKSIWGSVPLQQAAVGETSGAAEESQPQRTKSSQRATNPWAGPVPVGTALGAPPRKVGRLGPLARLLRGWSKGERGRWSGSSPMGYTGGGSNETAGTAATLKGDAARGVLGARGKPAKSSDAEPPRLALCIVTELMDASLFHAMARGRTECHVTTDPASPHLLGIADVAVSLAIALQAAAGLSHLHSKGMHHGDLKALNILLRDKRPSQPPVAKLCDFGTAQFRQAKPRPGIRVTAMFLAPEVSDTLRTSMQADVYAFGVTMWEILHPDWPTWPTPHEHPPGTCFVYPVPLAWASLIAACCHPNPAARPSALTVLRELQSLQALLGLKPGGPNTPPPGCPMSLAGLARLSVEHQFITGPVRGPYAAIPTSMLRPWLHTRVLSQPPATGTAAEPTEAAAVAQGNGDVEGAGEGSSSLSGSETGESLKEGPSEGAGSLEVKEADGQGKETPHVALAVLPEEEGAEEGEGGGGAEGPGSTLATPRLLQSSMPLLPTRALPAPEKARTITIEVESAFV